MAAKPGGPAAPHGGGKSGRKGRDGHSRDDGGTSRPLDRRTLRFAIGFPIILALAFAVAGLTLLGQTPRGIVLPVGGNPLPLPVYLAVAGICIIVIGLGLGTQASRTVLPRMARRIILGTNIAILLFLASLFGSALLAQSGTPEAPNQRLDGTVLGMGAGIAVSFGVVLAMSFKPEEQWTKRDDEALAQALSGKTVEEPIVYFLHPRSSVVIMILLAGVLPGAFLALLSLWWFVLTLALAAVALCMVTAVVTVDPDGIKLRLAGFIPALAISHKTVEAAVSLDVAARSYGGWGLRRHGADASFLASSGAAVVLRIEGGHRVVVGAPDLDIADDAAAMLNRHADA